MWQVQKDATVSKNLDHYNTDTPSYNTLICYNYEGKVNQLEDRSLERNLIFQGINKTIPDDVEAQMEKIYNAISNTISRDTPEERLQLARDVEIIKTRRLGKPDPSKTHAISVEFSNKYDVEQIYANRFNMEEGIYVERILLCYRERQKNVKTIPQSC